MKLKWGASTDVGMVRQQNEDSFLAEETLFVVADGMGGHNAGEVASALAVTTLKAGARLGIDDAEELVQATAQGRLDVPALSAQLIKHLEKA